MKKLLLITLGLVVLVLLARMVDNAGLLRQLSWQEYGQCEQVAGPVGAEDITIDTATGIAYIGADDRRAYLRDGNQNDTPNGAIWMLDLKQADSQPLLMKHDLEGVFHPHGIDFLDTGSRKLLYVVNHLTPTKHEIDVFEIVAPDQLVLQSRVHSDDLISPNDLEVVAEDEFYVTNDHANPRHSLMEKVEDYLGLAIASVVYFKGDDSQIVLDGLQYPNGIAVSEDGKWLFVAETTAQRLVRYEREDTSQNWYYKDHVDVQSGVDNLEWAGPTTLLTAAHPKLFAFMHHMHDAEALSPSEVLRISISQDAMESEILMLDDGSQLSGSSVAAMYGEQLLVGSVFEEHFLRCQP